MAFAYHSARYEISVENPNGVMRGVTRLEVDGAVISGSRFGLADDGRTHWVRVVLG
jgi:cyclic beta-1,2-glucan synthetase